MEARLLDFYTESTKGKLLHLHRHIRKETGTGSYRPLSEFQTPMSQTASVIWTSADYVGLEI